MVKWISFVLRRIEAADDGFGGAVRDVVLAAAPAVDEGYA